MAAVTICSELEHPKIKSITVSIVSPSICHEVMLELDMEQQTGSKLGREYCQGYISSPCLFNLYVEYIMRNAGLDEAQAGIKIAGRNINNLRYADVRVRL